MTLAYRHAFHAGNHADVLKHLVLMLVLEHLNEKPKGYRVVDTHAGAGGYSLEGRYARQKAEFETGIARLWDASDLPPALARYRDLVARFNPEGRLSQYPGSPSIAQMLMREQDELRAFELHPTEQKILRAALAGDRRAQVVAGDGFAGLATQLPPPTRRGLAIVDPSYEGRGDYARTIAALRAALQRFAGGVYLVWHPQVTKVEASELPRRLVGAAGELPWLHVRLMVQRPDSQGFGLAGSGVFVVHPPHTLEAELRAVLPDLTRRLAHDPRAAFRIDRSKDRPRA